MYPILISIGKFEIASLSLFIVLSWMLWSFFFWRHLRDNGGDEPHTFDLMFSLTLWAFIGARFAYVLFHFDQFSQNVLRIGAIWVQPGLSLYGALIALVVAAAASTFGHKGTKIRFAILLDAFALSLPWSFALGAVGGFLDGGTVGRVAPHLPWAVTYIGHIGRRHPVELYFLAGMILTGVISVVVRRKSIRSGLRSGTIAAYTAAVYAVVCFIIEFFTDVPVYWKAVSANQLVLIVLFGQAVGALTVYGGGKQWFASRFRTIRQRITTVMGGVYAKFSKRNPGTDSSSS